MGDSLGYEPRGVGRVLVGAHRAMMPGAAGFIAAPWPGVVPAAGFVGFAPPRNIIPTLPVATNADQAAFDHLVLVPTRFRVKPG